MEERSIVSTIRFLLFLNVIAAAVFLGGEFLGVKTELLFDPSADLPNFIALVQSEEFMIWTARGLVGICLEILGALGIYLALLKSRYSLVALAALASTSIGDVAGSAMFGTLYSILPALGEYASTVDQGVIAATQPTALIPILNLTFTVIGLSLFAFAIWRSAVLPRYSGLIVLVGFLLIPFPSAIIQVVANLLWLAGSVWMFVGFNK